MLVVKYKHWFFAFSLIVVILAALSFFGWGLKFGIEYTGGTIAEYTFQSGAPSVDVLKQELAPLNLGEQIQPVGSAATNDQGVVIRTRFLSEDDHVALKNAISNNGATKFTEKSFDAVGPVIGQELKNKAIWALILVIICIVIFIAFAFRKVSEPVASWKYGVVAIIALVHDIIVPAGAFGLMVHFGSAEIDILFTTALLAILGLSINDTIVVFDRIRENLRHRFSNKETFEYTVGKSLSQTYLRSFNTSFTVILALLALFLFGGDTTRYFSLTLLVGMAAGTYSSIFLAAPLLIVLNDWQNRKKVSKK